MAVMAVRDISGSPEEDAITSATLLAEKGIQASADLGIDTAHTPGM